MRIFICLLLCSVGALAQVPYVSSPTNSPVTGYTVQRTGDRNKWVPLSGGSQLWGTNDPDGGITNINSAFGSVNVGGTNAVILSDSLTTGNPLFVGRTNGTSSLMFRPDGSLFAGKYFGLDGGASDYSKIFLPKVVSITDSNGPLSEHALWLVVNNEDDFDSFGSLQFTVGQGTGVDMTLLNAGAYGRRVLNFQAAEGSTAISWATNFVTRFELEESGDLGVIKGVSYSWPSAHGAANSVLTDTDGAGTLSWATAGINVAAGTNVLATTNSGVVTLNGLTDTNVVNILTSARIGPGTNNFMAMFYQRTNVTTSVIFQTDTNEVDIISRPDGTAYTNSPFFRLYNEKTSANNYASLDFIAGGGAGSEIKTFQGSGRTVGRDPLKLNGTLTIEPNANAISGHTANFVYPATDAAVQLGSTSARFDGVFSDTAGFVASPSTGSGRNFYAASGFGMSLTAALIRFWDSQGTPAQFAEMSTTGGGGTYSGINIGTGSLCGNIFNDFGTPTIFLRGTPDRQVGLWQTLTNNPSGTPSPSGLVGACASGSDVKGGDEMIVGGLSTGAGLGGALILATAQSTSTSSTLNTRQARHYLSAEPITLTESTATKVCTVSNIVSGKFVSIKIFATTHADDGSNYQTVAEELMITDVNVAGTMGTAVVSAPALTASFISSGTLTTAWTAVVSANGLDLKCNAVSSLTQTTLKTEFEIVVHSDTNPHIYDASIRHL